LERDIEATTELAREKKKEKEMLKFKERLKAAQATTGMEEGLARRVVKGPRYTEKGEKMNPTHQQTRPLLQSKRARTDAGSQKTVAQNYRRAAAIRVK